MSASRLSVQLADLFTYLLVPGLAVVTPASFSRWILRKVSGWHWYLADAAEAAFQGTKGLVEVADEEAFKRRWKQVENVGCPRFIHDYLWSFQGGARGS